MEKQHSPLPWAIKAHNIHDNLSAIDIVDDYGDSVVVAMAHKPTEVNAALIVKSVNNHDALVKALKTCVVALYAHPELSSRAREAIQEAEAVLGQLEGKE